jgi:hypothetical protein
MYNGGIESNIPIIRSGIKKEEPKYISISSQTLLKIKIDAIMRTSSQKI